MASPIPRLKLQQVFAYFNLRAVHLAPVRQAGSNEAELVRDRGVVPWMSLCQSHRRHHQHGLEFSALSRILPL